MKANEAPEKIYLTQLMLFATPTIRSSDNEVEYTRTDAFIEKAVEWLENLFAPDGSIVPENIKLIEDFKNYMKGE
jgi:hypothetical protein